MSSVSVIDGKVRPCFERSGFSHSWYDESEVENDGFLVRVQYTSTLSLVVEPCSEKFGGNMVVKKDKINSTKRECNVLSNFLTLQNEQNLKLVITHQSYRAV